MTRHGLVLLLGVWIVSLASLSFASTADAQQPAPPRRIGVLFGGLSADSNEAQQFRQGLRDAGYSEAEMSSSSGDMPTAITLG